MKKLAIVGTGAETRDLAPFGDESFDIWVFNEAPNADWCRRFDASFQIHEADIYFGHNTKDPNYADWLRAAHGKPVYMQDADPLVPDSVRFPLEDAQKLGGFDRYLGATVCDAVALALLQGYERIEIWGIEMSFSEYQYQAECFRFWVGLAIGKLGAGNVVLHSGKHLFEMPLYGYEGSFSFGSEFFEKRSIKTGNEWDACEKNLKRIKAKLEQLVKNGDTAKTIDLVNNYQDTAIQAGELAGMLAESERYATFGERYTDRGGFEYAAAKSQSEGEELREEMYRTAGKVEYVWNVWMQTKNPQAAQQMLTFIERLGKQAYDMGARFGMYKENIAYILKYDAVAQANGAPMAPAKIMSPVMEMA